MHLSTPAIAFAILGFTSALPTAVVSKPAQPPSDPTTSTIALLSSVSTNCTTPIPITCTTSATTSTYTLCSTLCSTSYSTSCSTSEPPATLIYDTKSLYSKPVGGSTKPDNTEAPPSDPRNPPIRPYVTSQYDVWTSAVRCDETKGKIFKDSCKSDVTTLLTFNFPSETKGKTCSFHFDLSPDPTTNVSSTGQFDVFVSLAPATHSAYTWPSGNLRDQHISRMTAWPHGAATWVNGFPVFGQSFPCPTGETYSGELVSVGDANQVEWLASLSGPYITWS